MQKGSLVKGLVLSIVVTGVLALLGRPANAVSYPAMGQEQKSTIIYTTADLKRDYDIVAVITHYQEFAKLSTKDPLLGALKKGMEEFEKKVIAAGADAVVGLRYQFANPSQGEEGRLLIYGTAVKMK